MVLQLLRLRAFCSTVCGALDSRRYMYVVRIATWTPYAAPCRMTGGGASLLLDRAENCPPSNTMATLSVVLYPPAEGVPMRPHERSCGLWTPSAEELRLHPEAHPHPGTNSRETNQLSIHDVHRYLKRRYVGMYSICPPYGGGLPTGRVTARVDFAATDCAFWMLCTLCSM